MNMGTVTLSWSPPASDGGSPITGYKLYKGTASGAETLDQTLGVVTTFTDSNVAPGTYFYEVTAVNAVGESPKSNEAKAVVLATVPSAPQSLTATVS